MSLTRLTVYATITIVTLSSTVFSAAVSASKAQDKPASNIALNDLATTTNQGSEPVQKLIWNLPYEPLWIDPMHSFNYAESTVIANMCDNLLRLKPDLSVEPGLAVSVDTPDDVTYVYTLRSGVKFWDGSPLTPEDVVYSLRRQVGADSTTYYPEYFRYVKSIEQTGDMEITVHLSQPDALFNKAMASAAGAIVEKDYAVKAGESLGTPDGGIMCTGPFELDRWKSGKSLTLVKNKNYWDSSLIPKVKKLVFKFITNKTTAVNALLSGDIDGEFFYTPPAGLDLLKSSDNVTVTYGKSFVFWALVGAANSGPFSNPLVRRALLKSVNRQAIAKVVFQGVALPAPTLAGPAYWGYETGVFKNSWQKISIKSEPSRAKELLQQADNDIHNTIHLAIQGSSAVHRKTGLLLQAAASVMSQMKCRI